MNLGVLVLVVVVELVGLFEVGVRQLPDLTEYVAVGMHSMLDLGCTSPNVLLFIIYPWIILPVEVHPLHSGVETLNTSSVEPRGRRSSCTYIKTIWHTSRVGWVMVGGIIAMAAVPGLFTPLIV